MDSPRTPRSQMPSESPNICTSPTSYFPNDNSPYTQSQSRRSSFHSLGNSSRRSMTRNSNDFSETSAGLGLGNLADELGGAWDEEEEGEEEDEDDNGNAAKEQLDGSGDLSKPTNESEIHVSPKSSSAETKISEKRMSMNGSLTRRLRQRRRSTDRLSNSGSDPDTDLMASLEARIAAVETLARRGMGIRSGGADEDDVIERTAASLRDLGPQSGLESGNNRLTNAHISLATYINSQSQSLHNILFPLTSIYSPLSLADPDLLTDLSPILASLPSLLPRPALDALSSLTDLQNLTTDLVTTLSYLSDTLHITAQSTSQASRKLRATRDLVRTLRQQSDAADYATHWIEKADWNGKLERRECAKECEAVVGGFEEVCSGWRERLIAMNA